MAFLRPEHLKCLTLVYQGAVDNLTDTVLGFNRGADMNIAYIDFYIEDANATFDQTVITLEYDDGASGADTVIDANTVAANTRETNLDRDSITATKVPAGSRFLLTVDNVSTGADLGITFYIWYVADGEAAHA